MRVTTLIIPFGVIAASTALFRGPPADIRFSQEVIRGDADRIQLTATQQWSRAAEAEAFANSALRSATAVVLACLSAKLEVVVTEMISCPNRHDQPNCARARAANAKATRVCAEQIRKYTTAAMGFQQLNKALGRQLGAQLLEGARADLGAEDDVTREDPLSEGPVFGGDTTKVACRQASQMASESPMLTSPFPFEVDSRVAGFAKSVLSQVAGRACGLNDVGPARLTRIPRLEEETRRDCHGLEQQMACQVAYAEGLVDACPAAGELRDTSLEPSVRGLHGDDGGTGPRELALSSDVAAYASCRDLASGAAAGRSGLRRHRWLCSFDMARCIDDKIVSRSEAFLAQHVPSAPFAVPGITGTAGPVRAAQRSCTTVSRPVNPITQGVFGGLRRFASFGRARESEALAAPLRATSCGVWYCRDGPRGSHEGLPVDEQPFRPACYSGFALAKGP